jgi:hypothetical protein
MSLDILKERFNGKLTTIKYEQEIDDREKTIKNLEEETNNLSNQVVNLENEKNTLLQELNKARNFETGLFSTKQKEFENKINERKYDIQELESENYSLQEQINKKNERLEYKDKIINNSNNILKEAKDKINRLAAKLQNSKNSKKELKLEIRKTYKEYLFEINNFESQIKDKNQLISEQKQILKEKNKKIKQVTNIIKELKIKNDKSNEVINELNNKLQQSENSLIVENGKFQKEIDSKENTILELRSEMDILSNQVTALTETAQDKSTLEKRLQEAEQFQDVVKNTKMNLKQVPQMKSKLLNTDNLISMLKEVSKQKQGPKPLPWKQWIEIPENKYLNELNHKIAKKIFNENNNLYLDDDEKRDQYQSLKRYDKINNRFEIKTPDKLLPLTIPNLLGYYSSQTLAETLSDGDDITEWTDLSPVKNHLVTPGSTHGGDTSGLKQAASGTPGAPSYNAGSGSAFFNRRNPSSEKADYMNFKNTMNLDEFSAFVVLEASSSTGTQQHDILMEIEENSNLELTMQSGGASQAVFRGDDGTTDTGNVGINLDPDVQKSTRTLLTFIKEKFKGGTSKLNVYINKTLVGTEASDYNDDVPIKVQQVGNSNFVQGLKGHLYELAIYERDLGDKERDKLQDYFINRTNIST